MNKTVHSRNPEEPWRRPGVPVQYGSVLETRKPLLRRVLRSAVLGLLLLAVAPYVWGPIYRFPEPSSFAGARLWNPYTDLDGTWQRANLHAHGRAWIGLTNGQQPDSEVAQRYRDLGYNVPGVSDYQRIAAQHGVATMPLYEHGYNIGKHHQIAIGAHAVEWFDFPLWQSLSHQQYVIDRVKGKADLVALAHPSTRDAYTPDDLQRLTGYDLIEVVNGPFAVEEAWDAALSTGHPVWAVANDDTHDLTDPRRTAVGWNMIDAPTSSTDDVVGALRAGRSYAVLRTGAIDAANLTTVDQVNVEAATLTVSVSGAASTFNFIGQNGAIRKTVKDAIAASYTFANADTYVRTVITSPQTVLYLNPVVRYSGVRLPVPIATVDVASTWTLRGVCGLGGLLSLAFARQRRRTRRLAPRPVLADAKRHIA
jgi:hypothetical protein